MDINVLRPTPAPTLVVQAYNRPSALVRLLHSLETAHFETSVRLVISLDAARDDDDAPNVRAVGELADAYIWQHGDKRVIHHEERLGLVAHHNYCLGLSEEFGPIILLEDDLVVSATFYQYARRALAFYAQEPRIAGVALNALWFNGLTRQPFSPLPDESDVFFLQLATPQGQLYTPEQCAAYKAWREQRTARPSNEFPLHHKLTGLPQTDWLPVKDLYLAETGRYYVYPRESQSVNFGDVGTHFARSTAFFQVPLQQLRTDFNFSSLDASVAVYDSYFEILPDRLRRLSPRLEALDFAIDLYATKAASQITEEFVITARRAQSALWTVGKWLHPLEANLIGDGTIGDSIVLARPEHVDWSDRAGLAAQYDNTLYFNRYKKRSLKELLASKLRPSGSTSLW